MARGARRTYADTYSRQPQETSMADFYLPLSGPVTQTFPWTNYVTINLGESSNPAVEKDALSVASYGKQLGRIGDALIVLLKHVEFVGTLSSIERDAIRDLKSMLNEIANKKVAQGAKLVLRPSDTPLHVRGQGHGCGTWEEQDSADILRT
jgi:hypothetical protein